MRATVPIPFSKTKKINYEINVDEFNKGIVKAIPRMMQWSHIGECGSGQDEYLQ